MQYTDWMSQAEATSNVLPPLTVMVNKLLHQAVQDTSYNNTCRSVLATHRKKKKKGTTKVNTGPCKEQKRQVKMSVGGHKNLRVVKRWY